MGHGSTPSETGYSAKYMKKLYKLGAKQQAWWERMYQPTEQEMLTALRKPVEEQPYFKRMIGDIEKQYGDIGATTRRTLGGRYQYGSGYEGAAARNLGLSKARARGSAWQAGEEARRAELMNMIGLGRGLLAGATGGYGGAAQTGMGIAGMASQRDIAKMQGISSGAQSGMQICCFIFLEGHGELKEDVKRARDEMFPEGGRVSNGYRIMANWLVPLMRKSETIKAIIQDIMLDPIAEASKRYYAGEDTFPYDEIGFYWAGIWRDLSFRADAPMTREEYSQIARC